MAKMAKLHSTLGKFLAFGDDVRAIKLPLTKGGSLVSADTHSLLGIAQSSLGMFRLDMKDEVMSEKLLSLCACLSALEAFVREVLLLRVPVYIAASNIIATHRAKGADLDEDDMRSAVEVVRTLLPRRLYVDEAAESERRVNSTFKLPSPPLCGFFNRTRRNQ